MQTDLDLFQLALGVCLLSMLSKQYKWIVILKVGTHFSFELESNNMCLVPVFHCLDCFRMTRCYKSRIILCNNPVCLRRQKGKNKTWLVDEPCSPACFSEKCGLKYRPRRLCFLH